jgi:hypothetical protein
MGGFDTLARLVGEHPHVPALTGGPDIPPLSWWDVTTERAMLRSALYTDLFRPHEIGNQLNVVIDPGPPLAVLTSNRRQGEFSVASASWPGCCSPICALRCRGLATAGGSPAPRRCRRSDSNPVRCDRDPGRLPTP